MNNQIDTFKTLLSNLSQVGRPKPNDLALVRLPPPGANVPTTLPASGQQAITVSPPAAPILHGRPRTGAIASLPKDKRDMVCRMIANGVSYKKIAQALHALGVVVTERNISNWVTHGGYAEWCALYQDALQTSLRQDDLLQYHRSDNSPDLAEVGLQAAAVRLSELLLRQAAPTQDAETNFSRLEPVVNLLCRISKELLTVQKYRDDSQCKIHRPPAGKKRDEHDRLVDMEARYTAGVRHKLIDKDDSLHHSTEPSQNLSLQPPTAPMPLAADPPAKTPAESPSTPPDAASPESRTNADPPK